MISHKSILNLCKDYDIFLYGEALSRLKYSKSSRLFTAHVEDSGEDFGAEIYIIRSGKVDDTYCDCDDFFHFGLPCGHIVATLLAINYKGDLLRGSFDKASPAKGNSSAKGASSARGTSNAAKASPATNPLSENTQKLLDFFLKEQAASRTQVPNQALTQP